MRKTIKRLFLTIPIFICACSAQAQMPPASGESIPAAPTSPTSLTICLGDEPESLYYYAAESDAARLVLQAIYDGPIDYRNGRPEAVILENLPSRANKAVSVQTIEVNLGDTVINTSGDAVALMAGVQFFPSGCESSACVQTWDGLAPVLMDQLTATFNLKPGITWSDGEPLTAADSVYSYSLASNHPTPANKRAVNQTDTYTTGDKLIIEWISRPGLVTDAFENFFWSPLPEHAWGQYNPAELREVDVVNRSPLGWGAYKVDEWQENDSIRLSKNPHYYRAAEGLPYFDTLVFKIINAFGDSALSNLKFDRSPYQQFNFDVGEFDAEISQNGCDLVTSTSDLRDQLPVLNILLNYFQKPALKVFKSAEETTEFLLFNLRAANGASENMLEIPEVRQAISLCLDREKAIKETSFGIYDLPNSLFFSDDQTAQLALYDPEKAAALLEGSGWIDHDGQSQTPRIAYGVTGIPNGRELGFTYLIEATGDSRKVAEIFKAVLSDCGVGINIKAVPPESFWKASNEDSVFQGQFDLAQIAWGTPLADACLLFSSQHIPTAENDYLGINFSGFSNAEFDTACAQYNSAQLTSERDFLRQRLADNFTEALPMAPLYSYSRILAAREDFCGNELDSGFRNELSGIELFRISPECR